MLLDLILSRVLKQANVLPAFVQAIIRGDTNTQSAFLQMPALQLKQELLTATARSGIPGPLWALVAEDVPLFIRLMGLYSKEEQAAIFNDITKYRNPETGLNLLMAVFRTDNVQFKDFIITLFSKSVKLRARGENRDILDRTLVAHAIMSATLGHLLDVKRLVGDSQYKKQLDQRDLYQRDALMTALYVTSPGFFPLVAGELTEEQKSQQFDQVDSNGNTLLTLAALNPTDLELNPKRLTPNVAVRTDAKLRAVLNACAPEKRDELLKKRNKNNKNALMITAEAHNDAGLAYLLSEYSFTKEDLIEAYKLGNHTCKALLGSAILLPALLRANAKEITEAKELLGADIPDTLARFIAERADFNTHHHVFEWKLMDGKRPAEYLVLEDKAFELATIAPVPGATDCLVELAFDAEKRKEYFSKLQICGYPLTTIMSDENLSDMLTRFDESFSSVYGIRGNDGTVLPSAQFVRQEFLAPLTLLMSFRTAQGGFDENAFLTHILQPNNIQQLQGILNSSLVQNTIIKNFSRVIGELVNRGQCATLNDMLNIELIQSVAHQKDNELLRLLSVVTGNRGRIDKLLTMRRVRENVDVKMLGNYNFRAEYFDTIAPHLRLFGLPLNEIFTGERYNQELASLRVPIDQLNHRVESPLARLSSPKTMYDTAPVDNKPFSLATLLILRQKAAQKDVQAAERIELNNHESSMSVRLRLAADIAYQEGQALYSAEYQRLGLSNIESQIRGAILDEVLLELTAEDERVANNPELAAQVEEAARTGARAATRAFINANRAQLVTGANSALMQTAREQHFNSSTLETHSAWRACDDAAPIRNNHDTNYLTRNPDVRSRVAHFFLGLIDPQVRAQSHMTFEDRRRVFIGVLSEIRQAHGNDAPSCHPGTLGRTSKLGAGHPRLQVVDPVSVIPEVVQRLLTEKLTARLQNETDVVKAEYTLALEFISDTNLSDIVSGRVTHFEDALGNRISVERLALLRNEINNLLGIDDPRDYINWLGQVVHYSRTLDEINADLRTRQNPRVRTLAPDTENMYVQRQVFDLSLGGVASNVAAAFRPQVDERSDMDVVNPNMPWDLDAHKARISKIETSANLNPNQKKIQIIPLRRALQDMQQKGEYFQGIFPTMQRHFRDTPVNIVAYLAKMYVNGVFANEGVDEDDDEGYDKERPQFHTAPLRQAYEHFRGTKAFQNIAGFDNPMALAKELNDAMGSNRNRASQSSIRANLTA